MDSQVTDFIERLTSCRLVLLCYNTAMLIHPAETTLNWGAVRRLALAGLGVLLLWGAVWWAIQ